MALWSVRYDWKAGVYQHTTAPGFGHGLLTPLVTDVFGVLGIAVTLYHGNEWLPIHSVTPNLIRFEIEHGLIRERDAYNHEYLSRARDERRALLGEHAGYSDLFVPVVARGQVLGILVSGPFATRAATSADILARWKWLTGRAGHAGDPEFAWYVRGALGMVVLGKKEVGALGQLLTCFAQLMAGEGSAGELTNTCNLMRVKLEQAHFVERAWGAARTMLDERSPRSIFSEVHSLERKKLSIDSEIDHVLVGLMRERESSNWLDDAIARNAFQRRTTFLAKTLGGVLAGQVGDHGVVFLSAGAGSPARRRRKLHDLRERASALARTLGLSLRCGGAPATETMSLSPSYHAALAAAESALVQDKSLLFAGDESPAVSVGSLSALRAELGRVQEQPALLAARFERYLEAVSLHSGRSVESAMAHLEVGFEDVAESLVEAGVLEPKSLTTLRASLRRASTDARSMNELYAAYRRAFADIQEAVQRPAPARRDRSLQRALEYIGHHFADPLRISEVARVAGFTRSHFSRLFIEREGMPYEDYVLGLRLERAQDLLTSTELPVSRIAQLSGFSTPQYFCRVFKRALGRSPSEFRRAPQRGGGRGNQKTNRNSPGDKRGRRASR